MFRIHRTQPLPIGVDIGLDSIKMLQLEVVGEHALAVSAAARHYFAEDARNQPPEVRLPVAASAIRQLLKGHSFNGNRIVAALPREFVHIKNLRLPVMPSAEIESAVQFEARNIFAFDTDDAVVRHLVAGEVRQGTDTRLEVIALAAKRRDIDNYVEQLHRCGCLVESIDFEPSALYRSVERFIRRREDENEVHVLIDMGARRTHVIIGKGREVSFIKQIDLGCTNFLQDIARKLGITMEEARTLRHRLIEQQPDASAAPVEPDSVRQAVFDAIRSSAEELAREIGLCLRYYSVTFRGHRPMKARLLGAQASDAQVLSILSAALPIKIESGRPLLSVDTQRMKALERKGNLSEWSVAMGLGLKMSQQHYGAKDGRRRSSEAPADPREKEAAGVEVIDIGQQVREATHA